MEGKNFGEQVAATPLPREAIKAGKNLEVILEKIAPRKKGWAGEPERGGDQQGPTKQHMMCWFEHALEQLGRTMNKFCLSYINKYSPQNIERTRIMKIILHRLGRKSYMMVQKLM